MKLSVIYYKYIYMYIYKNIEIQDAHKVHYTTVIILKVSLKPGDFF